METGFNLDAVLKLIDSNLSETKEPSLEEQGYSDIQEIPGHGTCGIMPMLFTWGLFCKLDNLRYAYRFCYPTRLDAVMAINEWDGKDLPPGNWIKMKGRFGDMRNPKFPDRMDTDNE